MIKKVLFTGLLASACSMQVWSQTVFRSVEEVWKYADEHNVTIRIARYDLQKSGYSKSQTVGALLPQVAASASYTDNLSLQTTLLPGVILGKPVDYIPVRFGQQFIYSDGITAQMDIVNLQSWFNIQVAKVSEKISKDSLANNRKNVYQQVATQYYSLLLMQEAAKLSTQSMMISDSVYQSVKNKFETGTASKANVDVALINYARAQQTNITSQYQVQTARNNLKALLNMAVTDSLVIDAALQSNITVADHGNFTEDPTIKLAYHQMQQSMAAYRAGNSTYLPVISVLYSSTGQQNDNRFAPFSGDAKWYPANYWSLRASWTLFNGGNRYFTTRKNKISIEERSLQYDNIKKQSAINDENLRLSYNKAVALLENAQQVMDLSLDNYTHITYRYNDGISTLEDRLTAFSDYITYQNQYLNSLSDMLVQLYQIKIRQQSF